MKKTLLSTLLALSLMLSVALPVSAATVTPNSYQ